MSRRKDPLQYASGYTLDLYCDQALQQWQHTYCQSFYGQTLRECLRDARAAHWKVHADRTATCPKCVGGHAEERT